MSSYDKEHFDHIFFRMRESQPRATKFYIVIVLIKLLPMFFQLNSLGYTELNDGKATFHQYFRYLSMCFYIQNSLDINSSVVIAGIFLGLNLILVGLLIYNLSMSKKIKKIDENYGSQNSLNCIFTFFSILAFFKYILFNQFFHEINFMPLICLGKIDIKKINSNSIISFKVDENYLTNICTGSNFTQFCFLSGLNFIIDLIMNYILSSRFFDYNILSDFFWNSPPNVVDSILYFESFFQVFFIMFLNYENKLYRQSISYFYLFNLVVAIIRFFLKKDFYTIKLKSTFSMIEIIKIMCFVGFIIVSIFYFFLNQFPNDFILVCLIFIELFISIVIYKFNHRADAKYVAAVISSTNLNSLNNNNITFILCYLITEFQIFSDVNIKFEDERLDLFLSNYVHHLKVCEDKLCPCKNMTKKVKEGTNVMRSNINANGNFGTNIVIPNQNNNNGTGSIINTNLTPISNSSNVISNNNPSSSIIGGSHINFYQSKNTAIRDDYVVNRFFYNISANISSIIKNTQSNNININNIKDTDKQKIVYNLRLRLINAVKKLISYRLENYYKNIKTSYSSNLGSNLKHLIRINFFSLNLLLNRAYYKTIFLFHEFMADYFKKYRLRYKFNLIIYFYLKKCGIKDYNNFLNVLKSNKRDLSNFNLDFRTVLGNCTKFFDIERKLIRSIQVFSDFISYFEREIVHFDLLLKNVKKFRNSYKSLTEYIRYFFKTDKVNNLYVTSKIILYFKILQFDIPDSLHNKLVIQNYENNEVQSSSRYVDSNYYLIATYKNGDFIMNFVSHELFILLEYSQNDLNDQDFHILMPEKMREAHKELIINQIKNKNIHNIQYKEIILISKKRCAILFDLHFKVMLNLKGEITLLCVFNIKKPKKEFRTGFMCVDNYGEILALNKEFEDFLILSMKVLDYVKVDTDKYILQGLSSKIDHFFKDEENLNSEFYDRFDYEKYVYTIVGEEFEALKDKNENLYNKKMKKFASIRELVRKAKYNKYFDLYVKYRPMLEMKLYFVKFYIKLNINGRNMEAYNPTNVLINSIKISKRELAKLSTIKAEEPTEELNTTNNNNNQNNNDDHISDGRDFLNESQSILSSAAMILKSTNKKRLFKQTNKGFKFLPKSRNIILLSFFLGFFTVCSLILNIIFISITINIVNVSRDIYSLSDISTILKNHISYVTTGIINIATFENELFPTELEKYLIDNNIPTCEENTKVFLNRRIDEIINVYYKINHFNNLYFNSQINSKIEEINNNFVFLFDNGLIYTKNDNSIKTFNEISTIKNKVNEILNRHEYYKNITKILKGDTTELTKEQINAYNKEIELFKNFKNYILFENISKIQNRIISGQKMNSSMNQSYSFKQNDIFTYYFMYNLFSNIVPYLDQLQLLYENLFESNQISIKSQLIYLIVIQFVVVFAIIMSQYIFILIGYEKAKKKIKNLKIKIQTNNVKLTQKKIQEYLHFCNTFNIYSLYIISDFEINIKQKNENISNSSSLNRKLVKDITGKGSMSFKLNKTYRNSIISQNYIENNLNSNLNLSAFGEQRKGTHTPNFKLSAMELTTGHINDIATNAYHNVSSFKTGGFGSSNNINNFSFYNSVISKNFTKNDNLTEINNHNNNHILNDDHELNILLNNNFTKENLDNSIINDPNARKTSFLKKLTSLEPTEKFEFETKKTFLEIPSLDVKKDKDKIKGLLNPFSIQSKFRRSASNISDSNYNKSNIITKNDHSRLNLLSQDSVDNSKKNFLKLHTGEERSKINLYTNKNSQSFKRVFTSTKKKNFAERTLGDTNTNLKQYDSIISNITKKFDKIDDDDGSPILALNKRQNNLNFGSNSNIIHKIEFSSTIQKMEFRKGTEKQISLSYANISTQKNLEGVKNDDNKSDNNKEKDKSQLLEVNDLKEMKMADMNILDDVTLTKKKNELSNNEKPKEEEIERSVEQIIYKNYLPKIFLIGFGIVFLILYSTNVVYNINSVNNISFINKFSKLLEKRIGLLEGLTLRYQTSILLNNTKNDLSEYFKNIDQNQLDIIDMNKNEGLKILPLSYEIEKNIADKKFCEFISPKFSTLYNTIQEQEFLECKIIANQMNSNGFINAYNAVLNTLRVLYDDMKKLNNLSDYSLISKIMDSTYFNIKLILDYTFRKLDILEKKAMESDLEQLFTDFLNIEKIFSIISLILCIIFCFTSILIVILPIKSVEIIISWLIHKLLRDI